MCIRDRSSRTRRRRRVPRRRRRIASRRGAIADIIDDATFLIDPEPDRSHAASSALRPRQLHRSRSPRKTVRFDLPVQPPTSTSCPASSGALACASSEAAATARPEAPEVPWGEACPRPWARRRPPRPRHETWGRLALFPRTPAGASADRQGQAWRRVPRGQRRTTEVDE